MCRSSKSADKSSTEHEGAVFGSLWLNMDHNFSFDNKVFYLDHHEYDNLTDT